MAEQQRPTGDQLFLDRPRRIETIRIGVFVDVDFDTGTCGDSLPEMLAAARKAQADNRYVRTEVDGCVAVS